MVPVVVVDKQTGRVESAPEIVTRGFVDADERAELMEEVWGPGSGVSLRVIDTHVARLRRKLEKDPARPRHLLTALNQGYRFQQ